MGRRGYKNCPKCCTEMGARTLVCPECRHNFRTGKKERVRIRNVVQPVDVMISEPPTFRPKPKISGPPSLPKKKQVKCSWHPDYKGFKYPPLLESGKSQHNCPQCWSIFLKKQCGLDMVPRTLDRKIKIDSVLVAKKLITNLKECLKSAEHAGGAHSAFIGSVQIEVQTK